MTHQKTLYIQVAYLRVKIWWPQVGLPGMALHCQTLVITETQKSYCPATSLELLPKVSLLRSDHLSYLGIWDQKPICSLSGASSLSRFGPCPSLLISALAVSGIQRASSRITISCVWLPITRLHGADGILYYFSILDLEESLSDPPHFSPGVHQRNWLSPPTFLSRPLCKRCPYPLLLQGVLFIPDTFNGNLATMYTALGSPCFKTSKILLFKSFFF